MQPNLALIKLSEITPLIDINSNKVESISHMFDELGIIRNPLIVTPVANKKSYYLLEDSSILHSLQNTELEYVPVQVVDSIDNLDFEVALYIGNNILTLLDRFNDLFPRALVLSTEDNSGRDLNDGVLVSIEHKNHPVVFVSFRRHDNQTMPPSFINFLQFLKAYSRVGGNFYPFAFKSKNVKEFSMTGSVKGMNIQIDQILGAVESGYLFPSSSLHFKIDY